MFRKNKDWDFRDKKFYLLQTLDSEVSDRIIYISVSAKSFLTQLLFVVVTNSKTQTWSFQTPRFCFHTKEKLFSSKFRVQMILRKHHFGQLWSFCAYFVAFIIRGRSNLIL